MGLFGGGAKAVKKRVKRDLSERGSWQVMANGRTWICPFCAQPAIKRYPDDEDGRVDAVLEHLDGACPEWRGGEGEERHQGELRKVAVRRELRALVKKALVNSPSWQLIDVRRQWYCPYCATAPGIEIPGDRRMNEGTLQQILEHVERCYAYDHGRGEEKPLKQLKKAVKQENKTRKLTESVRRKLEEDPGWRRKGPESCWVCPYCLEPQRRIDLSSNLLMFENAPKQIALHLLNSCSAYRRGEQPQPLENSRGSTRGKVSRAAVPTRSGTETGPVDPVGVDKASRSGRRSLFDDSESDRGLADPSDRGRTHPSGRAPRDPSGRAPRHPSGLVDVPSDSSPFEASQSTLRAAKASALPGWSDVGGPDDSAFPIDAEIPMPRPDDSVALPPWDDEDTGSEDLRTTLRQLQGSGELIDEDDAHRSKAIEWRRQIKRELDSMRMLAPTSGEIQLSSRSTRHAQPKQEPWQAELTRRGLELQTIRMPGARSRGDFADVLDLGNGRLGLTVGGLATEEPDGHLVAAAARELIGKHAAHDREPTDVLQAVNQDLFPDLDGRNFFTCGFAILDVPTSRLRLCRAGLAPPYVMNLERGAAPRALDGDGMMMGIDRGPIFAGSLSVTSLQLDPGDMLVLYSNGIIEARAVGRDEFGLERMAQLVTRYARHEVEYFCDKFEESFQAFHAPPSRRLVDACVIALKRHPLVVTR